MEIGAISKGQIWTGRIMSGLVILFLLFDSTIKFLKIKPVIDSFNELGFSLSLITPIATILLVCVILYAIPATSVLGAILITGYLGGAVVTNLRHGGPLFSTILFPVYVGIFVWGGLYARDLRLRAIFPFRR